jgi:hypothetical protein
MQALPTRHPLQVRPRACRHRGALHSLAGPPTSVATWPLGLREIRLSIVVRSGPCGCVLAAGPFQRSTRSLVGRASQAAVFASVVVLARAVLGLLPVRRLSIDVRRPGVHFSPESKLLADPTRQRHRLCTLVGVEDDLVRLVIVL